MLADVVGDRELELDTLSDAVVQDDADADAVGAFFTLRVVVTDADAQRDAQGDGLGDDEARTDVDPVLDGDGEREAVGQRDAAPDRDAVALDSRLADVVRESLTVAVGDADAHADAEGLLDTHAEALGDRDGLGDPDAVRDSDDAALPLRDRDAEEDVVALLLPLLRAERVPDPQRECVCDADTDAVTLAHAEVDAVRVAAADAEGPRLRDAP